MDALLLPLLRSLDEQRIPKARMTVIQFAVAAFAKLANDGSVIGPTGVLKLWLGKLAPLAIDKNAKLREAAIAGFSYVYSHFDPTIVLKFILGLSIEEQSMLRRELKQFTPRIDLDLMAFLQNKIQRQRMKPVSDQKHASKSRTEELTCRALLDSSSYVSENGCYSTSSLLEGNFKRSSYQTQDSEPAGYIGEHLECNRTMEIYNGVNESPQTHPKACSQESADAPQSTFYDQDFFRQVDVQGSPNVTKVAASKNLTKRILLAALKHSPEKLVSFSEFQRTYYSSLYSRLLTKK